MRKNVIFAFLILYNCFMLKIEITELERQQLQAARYSHPHPRVMRKIDAVYLKSFGLPNNLYVKLLMCVTIRYAIISINI